VRKDAHDLFFNRKFNLHTLNEQAAKEEKQDLTELMQYLKSHDD